jgi:hypothetical protein
MNRDALLACAVREMRDATARIEEVITNYPLETRVVNLLSQIHLDAVRVTVELTETMRMIGE